METTYTTPRCDSRFRDYEDDFSDGPTPKAGTKRLFSNRDSKYSNISENFGENNFDDAKDERHSEKRYRNSDWPLPNQASANNTPQSRAPLRNRGTPNSHIGRRSSSRVRPSRFLEGSMNDRVSQKPPTPFLGDEEARERYEQDDYSRDRRMAQPRKTNRQSNTSTAESYADRSDVSRHSSIFRFGKSIAATFNPSNWKIWSKPQPQEADETPEQKILRERRERAEAIYQELKRNGQFRDSAIPPSFRNQEEDLRKHDSGVAFGRHSQASSTSRQEKRKGMVFLEPPQFDNLPQSPASNVPGSAPGSGRRSSFSFKKPSLRNMKSFAQSSDNVSTSGGHHQVRRIPSRKELHKQQKLVKRVSDLEMKLEAARRQLSDALGEPLPAVPPLPSTTRIGRSRFVPGALSTLLSERLLTGYPGSDGEEDDEDECGDIGTEKSPNEVEISSRVGRALTRDELLDDIVMAEAANSGHYEAEKDAMHSTPKAKTKKPLSPAVSIPKGLDLGMKIKPTRGRASTHATATTHSATTSDAPTEDYVPTESDFEEDEYKEELAEEDSLEVAEETAARVRLVKSKKRKSFERVADKSGTHKQAAEDSDDEFEVKNTTAQKRASQQPPQKVRKIILNHPPKSSPPKGATSTSTDVKQSSPQTGRQSSRQKRAPSNASTTRLTKPIPSNKVQQSMSPPPSSSFSGLSYKKPSSPSGKKLESPGKDVRYSAIPSQPGVPPMPPMPKAVRLSSGEMIMTADKVVMPKKLVKTKPASATQKDHVQEARDKADDSFEWPADAGVF